MLKLVVLGLIIAGCIAHLTAAYQPAHCDEYTIVGTVFDMAINRSPFPTHVQYPSLYSYLIAPSWVATAIVLHLTGVLLNAVDYLALLHASPLVIFWGPRVVSFLAWLSTVFVTWLIGREIFVDRLRPLLACLAFTCTLGTLCWGSCGLPDGTVMLFSTLSVLFAVRLVRGKQPRRQALIAGIFAGLAISTKYSGIGALFPPIAAVWLVSGVLAPERRRMTLIICVSALGAFLIGTPGWLLAFRHYYEGFTTMRAHMAFGHLGYTGIPVLGQLELIATADPIVSVLGFAGVVYVLAHPTWRCRSEAIVLLIALACILAVNIPAKKQSLQLLFPMYPLLALLAATWLSPEQQSGRRLVRCVFVAVCAFSTVAGVFWAYRVTTLPDGISVARRYIDVALPADAVVAMDWTAVPRMMNAAKLNSLRDGIKSEFVRSLYAGLRGFTTVPVEYDPAFLEDTEARYLVTSDSCYRRFFSFGCFTRIRPPLDTDLGKRFAERETFYRALFAGRGGWYLMREINTGNGPRVLIYERRGNGTHPMKITG